MKEILILAGILVGLMVLRRLVPFLLARLVGGVVGRAIGEHALSQQPDTIHLQKAAPNAWRNPGAVQPFTSQLAQRGFHDAGVHHVAEMPGLTLQLLVKSDEGLVAAIYEHPKAGHWLDLAARYQDGTSVTFSTSRPTGLNDRPGHPIHNHPEMDASSLYACAHQQMPRRPLAPVTPYTAGRVFEQAYTEAMTYRKRKGVSAREVANVAEKMRDAA